MAGDQNITVQRTDDFKYFAALAGLKADAANFLKQAGLRCFEALVENERCGGVVLIPKPCGWEMHTDLNEKCHGKMALSAWTRLLPLLTGFGRLTTYAPHTNRKAGVMAALAGFRRVGADADNVYYERFV
jgi:hypothetical protein